MTPAAERTSARRRRTERALVWIRWGGVGLGVFQVATYIPFPGETAPMYVQPVSYAILAGLAGVNVYVMLRTRRPIDERAAGRVGMVAFAADLGTLFGLTWTWSFEQFGTTWVILYLGPLEGAIRYGLAGSLFPVWIAIAAEPLRDLYRTVVFDFPFFFNSWTFRVGIMTLIGLFSGNLARGLNREREQAEDRAEKLSELHAALAEKVEALKVAREESSRRAGLLATVAATARRMSALETEQILAEVVEGVGELGFEAADFCIFDDPPDTYRVVHSRGLPDSYVRRVHRADEGLAAEIRRARATVALSNYSGLPTGIPELRRAGYRAAVGTPVWAQGHLAAFLVGGTRAAREVQPEEVEAIELLAAQAGRALENARLFEEERRTVERLEELDRMKQDFLDNVSHELRTPLTAIQGMGITLHDRWTELTEEVRRDLLERLNANAGSLHEIIATLLDFSRLESGRVEINRGLVTIDHLVHEIAARLDHLLVGHAVTFLLEPGAAVRGDGILLERVVENLLSNAAKHTPEGTPITVSAAAVGEEVEVAVGDEGPGIAPRDLSHLTERFYRGGDPNERARGTGLGLSLVQEILSMHGSTLAVESEPGKGARFSFRLPRAASAEHAAS